MTMSQIIVPSQHELTQLCYPGRTFDNYGSAFFLPERSIMNVDHFPTLRACVDTTSIRLFATSALLATCFAFAINPCSVEVSAGETLRLIADKDVDPFSEQYSNEYVKLLSNQDVREELSQPRSLPEPTQPTENIDALAPAPQSSSKSSSRCSSLAPSLEV